VVESGGPRADEAGVRRTVNPFELLLWFTETFHIENWGQLEVWLIALDLYAHFVTSAFSGCLVFALIQRAGGLLFSRVGSRSSGGTTWAGLCILTHSLLWGLFASSLVHCWLDYGWGF
jgi:hypothetical protein